MNQQTTPRIDALLVSYPKSGRTWLRFMIATYLHRAAGGASSDAPDLVSMFRLVPNLGAHPEKGVESLWAAGSEPTPAFVASHDGQHVASVARSILLLRDPGETVVSHYFHETRHRHGDRFAGSFEDFLKSRQGLPRLGEFLRQVTPHRADPGVLTLTYDDLHHDPGTSLRRVLAWAGHDVTDQAILDHAVRAGSFDEMVRIENLGGTTKNRRRLDDPDARRVRRGEPDRGETMLDDERRSTIRSVLAHAVGDDIDQLRAMMPPDWTL